MSKEAFEMTQRATLPRHRSAELEAVSVRFLGFGTSICISEEKQ